MHFAYTAFSLQLIIKSATFFLLHAQLIKDDFQRAKPGKRGLQQVNTYKHG
jgi:hypothetical protein